MDNFSVFLLIVLALYWPLLMRLGKYNVDAWEDYVREVRDWWRRR